MAFDKNKLSNLINEAIEEVLLHERANPVDEPTKETLLEYISWLRMMHLWFHGAHHITTGPSFAGDHVNLYGMIYAEIQDEVDGATEKVVGITNDKTLAEPICIVSRALEKLQHYRMPHELSPTNIAAVGLQIEKDYIAFIENMFEMLEMKKMLTLGLNDQLAASANTHERYVYLLQQRVAKNYEEY